MRRALLLLIMGIAALTALAQKAVLSGVVANEKTGEHIAQASVAVAGTDVRVVTNDDGYFTLKLEKLPATITVSHVGYESYQCPVAEGHAEGMRIKLKPATIQLNELVVWTGNPRELMNIAIRKIPGNYSTVPQLYNCFYRETAMKRKHFIYVAEGVVDMYKTDYTHSTVRDRVAIRKGRRLLSPKKSDTLSVKVTGGPVQPVQLDIVKNLDFLLNAEELAHYDFKMEMPEVIDNRMQYVVSIAPAHVMPYALYFGKFYIDRETLAFTRAELTLDVSDRDKATSFMLVRKPLGVKFKPRELSCLIDYRYDHGVTHISYIRNTFRFNCDWRKRLFATSFTACCEMVVTDRVHEGVHPIPGRSSFDTRDAFYDRVEYFQDPDFWKDYNIIEPTESLDKAIGRLLKKF